MWGCLWEVTGRGHKGAPGGWRVLCIWVTGVLPFIGLHSKNGCTLLFVSYIGLKRKNLGLREVSNSPKVPAG